MIKYNLKCQNEHEFESWFSDSNEFDNLKKKNLLECVFCPSKKISKSIMSPMISGINNKKDEIKILNENIIEQNNKLLQLRKFVENNFEYVGKNFSSKVRDIYYNKKSEKMIYGTTTPDERRELEEEGISLLSIPWVSKNN